MLRTTTKVSAPSRLPRRSVCLSFSSLRRTPFCAVLFVPRRKSRRQSGDPPHRAAARRALCLYFETRRPRALLGRAAHRGFLSGSHCCLSESALFTAHERHFSGSSAQYAVIPEVKVVSETSDEQ